MKALFDAWWDERNAREKRILSIGVIFLALLIFYQVLVAPALNNIATIRETLPGLKRQLANMQEEAGDARQLGRTSQSVSPTGDSLVSAISSSLEDHGMRAETVQ